MSAPRRRPAFPYLAPYPAPSGPGKAGTIPFAHRGGAACWPENTLLSFGEAVALGYRYIETDVHMSRDGAIVCLHDARVDRTTDGRGLAREMTLRELRRLDAGYRFSPDGGQSFPYRGAGLRIPTLEEALALHPEVRLNIEIKQGEPDMCGAVWREIERLGAHDRVLIAAEHEAIGLRFRERAKDRVATSASREEVFRFFGAVQLGLTRYLRWGFDALQVPWVYGGLTVVDEAFVRAAHAEGIAVHVWTIDDAESMRALLDLGVDGLMTDQPALLMEVLREDR